ncbi:unnamed protein product [Adineta ricciae]|uniref:Uncharacterized protein n=1 Tax=Adineta ricciae TaxID=249248 RepID=A0A816E0Q9_ADIRI|nr:unnamed protein product [Adineta ricciae]
MPFAVKDALHYKRNDRQIREIHEREYSNYVKTLRQQQLFQQPTFSQITPNHFQEIERSRVRYTVAKQIEYDRIGRENHLFLNRLHQASERTLIDHQNQNYLRNLSAFNCKRSQQRSHDYERIYTDNQLLLHRLSTTPGRIANKEQCERDWKRHVDIMKKSCDYPENIDRFVTKVNKTEQKQICQYEKKRDAQWNRRHYIIEPSTQLTATPLALLLNES